MSRGLYPHTPTLDPPCHDLVIMDGAGTVAVTQVKSATSPSFWKDEKKTGRRKYCVKALCNNDSTLLKDSFVDVLAVFIPHALAWYLIPTQRITGRTVNLVPHLPESKAQYEKYLGDWSIFGSLSDPMTGGGPGRKR